MEQKHKLASLLETLSTYEVNQSFLRAYYGKCWMESRLIQIRVGLTPRQGADTLIHESLHAYYYDLGIDASETRVRKETREIMGWLYGKN
jgi:hypothetical protein